MSLCGAEDQSFEGCFEGRPDRFVMYFNDVHTLLVCRLQNLPVSTCGEFEAQEERTVGIKTDSRVAEAYSVQMGDVPSGKSCSRHCY